MHEAGRITHVVCRQTPNSPKSHMKPSLRLLIPILLNNLIFLSILAVQFRFFIFWSVDYSCCLSITIILTSYLSLLLLLSGFFANSILNICFPQVHTLRLEDNELLIKIILRESFSHSDGMQL